MPFDSFLLLFWLFRWLCKRDSELCSNYITLIRRGLSSAMKCHGSKIRVFLVVIKTVFPMFVRRATRFVEIQMPDKGCLGTLGISSGNRQRWCTDAPARHNWTRMWICAGCQMRLHIISKFPVSLAGIMWHLPSTDSAAIPPKQPERQFTNKKNTHSKNCWHFISDKEKFPCESA